MLTSMVIPLLRRHAILIDVILAILGLTMMAIELRYDSIQLMFTHGDTQLNIETTTQR